MVIRYTLPTGSASGRIDGDTRVGVTFGPCGNCEPVVWFDETVFIYYYVQLKRPINVIEPRFRSFFSRFSSWAESAYREGEELRANISVGSGPATVAKTVRMRVGDPVVGRAETTVPIVWEATGPTALFPIMEGNLIMAGVGPEYTQLAFRGTYEPPMGALGRALDKVVMHRLAESSVKGFVDRISEALERE